ncbi:hypothetical protein F2Q70_00036741 [Brassica cretica]|uniref:Uncharacterized protein n=2 Tax=Brassica cretica TaxID=69181 RepID=A0A8S9G7X4_BRACR|nr:hypothetical protein F2Q68_00032045 [Brassica cretica]KAF2584702.1 hypothetical protein F2Q70_00036741 [Brassica cretica]KAF3527655.1 hypothetical protein DY000_02041998 [Brassica cretica]
MNRLLVYPILPWAQSHGEAKLKTIFEDSATALWATTDSKPLTTPLPPSPISSMFTEAAWIEDYEEDVETLLSLAGFVFSFYLSTSRDDLDHPFL